MARLPLVPETEIPAVIKSVYQRVVQGGTELPTGFQALFASPGVDSQLDGPG